MPKPNYRFNKKQREMKKTQKQEEKRQKKLARGEEGQAPLPPGADDIKPENGQ